MNAANSGVRPPFLFHTVLQSTPINIRSNILSISLWSTELSIYCKVKLNLHPRLPKVVTTNPIYRCEELEDDTTAKLKRIHSKIRMRTCLKILGYETAEDLIEKNAYIEVIGYETEGWNDESKPQLPSPSTQDETEGCYQYTKSQELNQDHDITKLWKRKKLIIFTATRQTTKLGYVTKILQLTIKTRTREPNPTNKTKTKTLLNTRARPKHKSSKP